MLCHPPAGLTYQVKAPAGSSFICDVGLSPQVWQDQPPRVEFTSRRPRPGDELATTGTVSIDPGGQWTDRRWHPVAIPLPPTPEPALDVQVSLSTRVARGRERRPRVGAFRRAALRMASSARGSPELAPRRSRGAFAPRAFAARSSFSARRESRRTTPKPTRAGSRATHPTNQPSPALARDVAALPLQPLISVVTPIYNTEPKWLRACIESVRRQVYANWELCLCDDASTSPETIQTLREYEDDPRIRIRYLSVNAGISAASNSALAMARGEFVALLDHDDELRPDALAEVVKHLNAHPDADVFYSDEDKLDLAGRALRSLLQARLVARPLPVVHVYLPLDGDSAVCPRGDRRLPDRLRGRAGLRPSPAHCRSARAPDRGAPHPADPVSLAEASAVDRERGSGQAVGARCGTAGARGLCAAHRLRRGRRARRRTGTVSSAAPDSWHTARLARRSQRPV